MKLNSGCTPPLIRCLIENLSFKCHFFKSIKITSVFSQESCLMLAEIECLPLIFKDGIHQTYLHGISTKLKYLQSAS